MWGLSFLPNEFSYPFVFKFCSVLGLVEPGRMIREWVLDKSIGSVMGKSGIEDASFIRLKEIHGFAIKQKGIIDVDSIDDDKLRASIVAGYAFHRCMSYACRLFEEISLKTSQLLISMISGFIECKQTNEALRVFRDMIMQNGGEFKAVSKVPLTLLLPECSASSLTGLEIHGHAYRVEFESTTSDAFIMHYSSRCTMCMAAFLVICTSNHMEVLQNSS
ncbi:hypothetical protein IFM89_036152 [Coptis chinensis]|uniref:Pentatricopeptide repeat-containing protein n=1 Tax=Coptis chinensis TaxID=261450 RepID=A0A835GZU7_9MAGN|nr:hypothetical protein IFM89_036152 [Coptis chinensis]